MPPAHLDFLAAMPGAAQAELGKDLAKTLMAAQKQAKQNGDEYVGTDTLIKALTDNKDIASALTEAGKPPETQSAFNPAMFFRPWLALLK